VFYVRVLILLRSAVIKQACDGNRLKAKLSPC